MNTIPAAAKRSDRHVLLLLTLPWIIPGLIASFQVWYLQRDGAFPLSFAASFAWQMSAWLQWAIWTVAVRRLALRYPLDRLGGRRWAALHISATLVVSACELFLNGFLDLTFNPAFAAKSIWQLFRVEALLHLDFTVMVYWTMLGSIYMVEFHRRYRQRDLDAARLKAELVASQLEALRMQLNPHFLFNALNGVSELLHSDPQSAQYMISRISELLRQALRTGAQQEILLLQEVALAEAYLDIARMRFGNEIELSVSIAPDAKELAVPALILQPLLENAVHHGFRRDSDDSCIEIRARRAADDLQLEIADNGRGLSKESVRGFGIGLSNIRARLETLYGARATLILEPGPAGGCIARICIPAHGLSASAPDRSVSRTERTPIATVALSGSESR